ncbi:acetolactate synthase isozyme I large subunit [Escherichia coli]|uniref:Acetolactate synthase isozyme I large subunit n=1 Tax=Escherichia coli TaxID=562 RepID=A0A376TQW3_ECOLX|nr:acetolactate synthase isozyme I large subunit [Escherichia coli]
MTGRLAKPSSFCPNAKIIHVDIDRAELGKIKQPHVAIQADVDDVLAQLIPAGGSATACRVHQLVADLQRRIPVSNPESVRSIKPLRPDQRRCRLCR